MTITMQNSNFENNTRCNNHPINGESHDLYSYPDNISIDNNNNETPKHINSIFERGKKYDSGLEILSPQSDKSVTNIFLNSPDEYSDKNGNHYSTMTLPYSSNDNITTNNWTSLNINSSDSTNNNDDEAAEQNVIQFKSLDLEKNSKTKIVIYRNENGNFRHVTIQDFLSRGVRRSNTFSHDRNDKECFINPMNAFHSTDNLPCVHYHNFPENIPYSSCSELYQLPQKFESQSENIHKPPPKFTLKQRILSGICSCIRPMCKLLDKTSICAEEDENNNSYSSGCALEEDIPSKTYDWQFSLVEFNDLTYLSSGAEGSVYTAILNGVKVALKKVSEKKDVQIENLLKLKHENIITFMGVCTDNPFYIVMEYCSEGQLYQWLRRDIDISVNDIISWTKQLCNGMAYLHFNDIIHRDLKSPNALITDRKIIKIIDFGFGKSCQEDVFLNSFVGTMAWMAPEVIRAERHTKKIDIWSFGVVLWEMITRQIPYIGVETVKIIFGVGEQCLSLPIYDSFPRGIELILKQCWKHNPDERPSFDDIILNLDTYFEELRTYDQDGFDSLQLEWKSQIENCFQNMTQARISTSKVEAELIRRRTKELKDARDIKHLYNEKLMRADKLIELLTKCLNAVEKERLKNEKEWKLIQGRKQYIDSQKPYDYKNVFLSLGNSPPAQSNGPLKSYKSPIVKLNKKVASEKIQNRHSMLESVYPERYNTKVRRKHSVPISKEKNAFFYPSILKRTSQCINSKVSKVRAKKKSISCETLYNTDKDVNNQLKSTNKRYSNPIKENHFSTLPQCAKSNNFGEQVCGNINPSFESSHDSLNGLIYNHVLKNYNKNIQQLVYFGPSASITDLNLSSDLVIENPNNTLNPNSLIRHNILEDSITECPHYEEDSYDGRSITCDAMLGSGATTTDSPVVMIRMKSGRKSNNSGNSIQFKDSLDTVLTDSQNHITDSINEKEKIAQNLIEPCNFLTKMVNYILSWYILLFDSSFRFENRLQTTLINQVSIKRRNLFLKLVLKVETCLCGPQLMYQRTSITEKSIQFFF